ncbi:transglycosylase SLT domain-containing protein [Saccharopolyspora sp. K220]|uniref:transglycosylase SLT domain-containing protein n=1 Tax=Saccharopolyspora soli TaxID=2926618 RepID=UPI001F5608B7|nr:transglycosylase SLT domain-containing protein [Saccharopolyspora soli]MCI2420455.1 transglycosylase SLT domain-containing protein [Saccharopolyspora soli]
MPRTATWLRAAFVGDSANRQHRVPPKTRSLQVGAAVAAIGVIGVFSSVGDAQTEQPAVQAAAQVAPLADATPLPAQAPLAPQAPPAPEAAPAPQVAPEAEKAAEPVPDNKPKDQVGAWIDQAQRVLEANGISRDHADADAIRMIIMHESNGDPTASNNWDSNAAAGTPSIGLMQTIEPTFESFALPGHGDIYNPVDNIIAATRYSISRYGSMSDVPGVASVRSGGSYQGY